MTLDTTKDPHVITIESSLISETQCDIRSNTYSLLFGPRSKHVILDFCPSYRNVFAACGFRYLPDGPVFRILLECV